MPRYFWSWLLRRRPAFPTTPVTTDERIPKIYNWIETCFWPKLTPDQQREMLPLFKRIKFGGTTEVFTEHWLGKAARSSDSLSMVKVLVHAIWGAKANASWWNEYHQMVGHLKFPEGPAPGVAFGNKSPRRQWIRNSQQMDALRRRLTLVTKRVNLAIDKVDSVQQQVRQQQIEDGNKMDAMHRQLTLVIQKQIEDGKKIERRRTP